MMKNTHKQHSLLIKPVGNEFIPGLNGLVLAGGESRRMGRDKASILYHGIPQHEYMVQLLNPFVTQTYISCHPDRRPETIHPVLTDTFLDLGPYGGVLSSFRHDPNCAWLAVACDIPLLDKETIAQLIMQRDPAKAATCIYDPSTDLPEPLLTIWEPKAYPALLQFLGQGISCLRKALIHSDTHLILIDRPEVLKNANTPEESAMMRNLLQGNDSFP